MLTIHGLMLQVALNQITPVCNLVSIHRHICSQCLLRPLSITALVCREICMSFWHINTEETSDNVSSVAESWSWSFVCLTTCFYQLTLTPHLTIHHESSLHHEWYSGLFCICPWLVCLSSKFIFYNTQNVSQSVKSGSTEVLQRWMTCQSQVRSAHLYVMSLFKGLRTFWSL